MRTIIKAEMINLDILIHYNESEDKTKYHAVLYAINPDGEGGLMEVTRITDNIDSNHSELKSLLSSFKPKLSDIPINNTSYGRYGKNASNGVWDYIEEILKIIRPYRGGSPAPAFEGWWW